MQNETLLGYREYSKANTPLLVPQALTSWCHRVCNTSNYTKMIKALLSVKNACKQCVLTVPIKVGQRIMKDEMIFRSILQHIHMFAVLFACEYILYKYNIHRAESRKQSFEENVNMLTITRHSHKSKSVGFLWEHWVSVLSFMENSCWDVSVWTKVHGRHGNLAKTCLLKRVFTTFPWGINQCRSNIIFKRSLLCAL